MNYTPAIGDVLVREKALGIFDHVSVVVAPGTVIQNTPERGEHLATVREFAAGQPIKVRRTGADPSHVLSRTRRVLANAKAYNPFSRNCEHTASEVTYGLARSRQLVLFVGLALVVILLAFLWPRR